MKPPVTVRDYLDFFAAVQATDLNGNGEHDEIPFYAQENMGLGGLFFGAFGVYPGTWNRDLLTTKSGDWFNNIRAGKAAMWMFWAENYQNTWAPELFVNQPEARIGLLGGPLNGEGKQALSPATAGILRVFVIPAKTRDPQDIIKFFDWAWSDDAEKDKFFAFGIKDYNYTEENGQIAWDEQAPVNNDLYAVSFYQMVLNPQGDGRAAPMLLDKYKYGDKIKEAAKIAGASTFAHDDMNMPTLKTINRQPELGYGPGSLYFDMFVRALTGREEPGQAFDAFVANWKSRGGDKAIQEATDWYRQYAGQQAK